MEITIKTVNGKIINLEVDDTSDTIDLKIHGPTRQLVLRLGPDLDSDSDQEAIMRISASTLTGRTYILEVQETETIADVMAKICAQSGLPVDQQRLIFAGKQLDDRRTLAKYNVKSGSTLGLLMKQYGC